MSVPKKKVLAEFVREGKPTITLEGTEDAAGNQIFNTDGIRRHNKESHGGDVAFFDLGSTVTMTFPWNNIATFKKGVIHYRDVPINELTDYSFGRIAYLVVYGKDESTQVRDISGKAIRDFEKKIVEAMALDEPRLGKIENDLKLVSPMSALAQVAGTFGGLGPKEIQNREQCDEAVINIIGRTIYGALTINREIRGLEPIETDRRKGIIRNVAIQSLEGTPSEALIKNNIVMDAFRKYFAVHVAHGWPLSTCNQLNVLSGGGTWWDALSSAIIGLGCDQHANACAKALEMYRYAIRKPENARYVVREIGNKKEHGIPTFPLWSIGHRIVKNGDARVPILDEISLRVQQELKTVSLWRQIAKAVVAAAAKDPYFASWGPNVDNLGGVLLEQVGAISMDHPEGAPLMFTAARSVGLAAMQREVCGVKLPLMRAYQPSL